MLLTAALQEYFHWQSIDNICLHLCQLYSSQSQNCLKLGNTISENETHVVMFKDLAAQPSCFASWSNSKHCHIFFVIALQRLVT